MLMTHPLKLTDNKDAQCRIPLIYIENNCCPDTSAQDSPPSFQNLPPFISDNDFLPERGLSFQHQVSQFVCWFNELTPSRQFLFTALSLRNISSDYLKLVHSVTTERLSENYQHVDVTKKASDIGHLDNLDITSDDFRATILDLLSSLNVPNEQDAEFSKIHDKYLALVDKALENSLQQKLVFEDAFDSLEGQLLIAAMTTPLFSSEDRQWLQNNIKSRSEACSSWQSTGLLTLANDLLEIFEFHKGSCEALSSSGTSLSRNFRSSSINSPFPFLPRSLYPYPNRRHHSLVPQISENSLIVPSPFTSPHVLSSSSSPNSSGFVSGSESMYQGLNESTAMGLRGNRLSAPSNSRLYLLRRQSTSPYTPQEGELKEEDDSVSTNVCGSMVPDKSGFCNRLVIPAKDEILLTKESAENANKSQEYLSHPPLVQEISNLPCLTLAGPPPYKVPPITVPLTTSPSPNICGDAIELSCRPSISSTSPLANYKKSRIRRRNVSIHGEQVEDPGMARVPVWLKSLRLHKYIGLFKRLTYFQMLGITDEWLQRQHVTRGARNKIIMSIANLSTRSATLTNLEARIEAATQNPPIRSSNLRRCLSELRSILQTPFPPSTPNQTPSSPLCLSSTSSAEDSTSVVGAPGTGFMFGSDVEDYVEDEGEDDDEGEFMDLRPASGSLCQCPCTSSDTCLFGRTNTPGGEQSPKRPKSSEGGSPTTNFFFPPGSSTTSRGPSEMAKDSAKILSKAKGLGDENLSEQIMRSLNHGFKALIAESIDDDDIYGFFMQLLTLVLDHPSFSRAQKEQVTTWQKQMVDRLGPAPPPHRRSYHHHHRAASHRFSHHYHPLDRGGSYSAPYTPRSNVGCGGFASRPYFASPMRLPYLHQQQQMHSGISPTFLQNPSQFGGGGSTRWSGGMVRGRSAEPDVCQHQQGPSRPAFHEQTAALVTTIQQRVASMDSLTVSSPYGFMEPRGAAHQFFTRNRMVPCHDPSCSDFSTSMSPFASPELQSASCFTLMPNSGNIKSGGEDFAAATTYLQPPPHPPPHPTGMASGAVEQRRWLADTTTTVGSSTTVDYSTAEINRNLELLTEKVTKLAMGESDSPSE